MFRLIVVALSVVAAVSAGGLVEPTSVIAAPGLLGASPILAPRAFGYGGLASPYGLGLRSNIIGSPYGYTGGFAAPYAAPYGGFGAPIGLRAGYGLGLNAPLATSYAYGHNLGYGLGYGLGGALVR